MTSLLPAPLLPVVLAALGLPAGSAARRLLGRLRRGARVPPPWCELGVASAWLVTGALAAAEVLPWRWVPVLLGLGWLAVAAGAVDLLHHRLPDALTLPALPLTLLLLAPVGGTAVLRGLAGAAVAAAAYAALHLVAPAAMGAGDVKLAAPLGAVLAAASWPALALGAAVAALLSGGAAVAALVYGGFAARGPTHDGFAVVARVPGRSAVVAPGRGGHVPMAGCGTVGRGRTGRGALRRIAVPHGPSMLVAAWVVATVTAGAGPRGP
jgi:leader peptidase (prepilin peptidase)/N-methyltransferase